MTKLSNDAIDLASGAATELQALIDVSDDGDTRAIIKALSLTAIMISSSIVAAEQKIQTTLKKEVW